MRVGLKALALWTAILGFAMLNGAAREALLVPTLGSFGAFVASGALLFEFGFGRLVQGKSWSELWEAYTFAGGNIWPLVLVVVLLSPWLAAKSRKLV